ncbi:Fc receptor-like protein 5 [Enoplosus armatus]|uniref:Fc receptor-like protein 5 n=1 Tax=Enoplosus armatus TaxID=215367 RepID=UPI003992B67A
MKAALLVLLLLSTCWTSAHSRASVMVTGSQYFEYESFSVSCERFSSGEWTVWRYTTKGSLSQCGSGWGSQTSSTCNMKAVKLSDSGVYWCESKHRDSSNAVNITVTDKLVILQSPVLPVMEGDDVTLHCKPKPNKTPPSNLTAAFYKDGSLIRSESTGHMTIHNFSKSDEGAYKCLSSHGESPPSWLLMKDDADPASLTVSPNSSQLFEYKNLDLSCGDSSSFREWKVVRSTTSGGKLSGCGEEWGIPTHSGCLVQTAKKPDSAIYWCESPARQRSNSVNITVYGRNKPVILQSPVLPVTEGHDVTLHCTPKTSPSNLTAAFYKDGSLIRTEPTGHMTIHRVSRSDEGLYKCHSHHGESPPSWLFVRDSRGTAPSTADPTLLSVLRVIRHLVVLSPYCISTVLMVSLFRHRPTGRNPPVSMATYPPSEDDEGLDQPYDDVIADVTTEYHF